MFWRALLVISSSIFFNAPGLKYDNRRNSAVGLPGRGCEVMVLMKAGAEFNRED